jgi:aminopeptidase N
MKTQFLLLILSLPILALRGQTNILEEEKELNSLFEQKKYYQLLSAQDAYLAKYPAVRTASVKPWIMGQRIYSWIMLYDMENLRKDLLQIDATNSAFIDKIGFRPLINIDSLAKMTAKGYISDPVFDPGRNYRLKLTACDTIRGSLSPLKTCYDVNFYDLKVTIDPVNRSIQGLNKIHFTAVTASDSLQVDLFQRYQIESVMLDGSPVGYSRKCDAIFIGLDTILEKDQRSCLEIRYSGIPPEAVNPPWNGGFVWKEVKGRYWAGVACEHLGASSWWPLKDHQSDKPDSMLITLTVPAGYQALSNGNLRSVKPNENQTTSFEWYVSYPINSYNVTFYLGDFVNFSEEYKGKTEDYRIDYYVLKKSLKKSEKYYANTHRVFEVFSELYGEYPFPDDGAAFVEAPFAGMEHQSAIAIGSIEKERNRPMEIPGYDLLVVHETAHEWWGNALAVGDMADAWINEGFATYTEWLFMEHEFGHTKYIEAFGKYAQRILNGWPIVGNRNVNDNTFITGDIYNKGAAMLHNMRCTMNNDSLFFAMIKGFYQKYELQLTCTEDFIAYACSYYPFDSTGFFKVFLYQDQPPALEYSFILLGGDLLFNYRWIHVPESFTMPFCIMINDDQCIRLTGTTTVQRFKHNGAGSFYITTPARFDPEKTEPNSFTYFQTHYVYK